MAKTHPVPIRSAEKVVEAFDDEPEETEENDYRAPNQEHHHLKTFVIEISMQKYNKRCYSDYNLA